MPDWQEQFTPEWLDKEDQIHQDKLEEKINAGKLTPNDFRIVMLLYGKDLTKNDAKFDKKADKKNVKLKHIDKEKAKKFIVALKIIEDTLWEEMINFFLYKKTTEYNEDTFSKEESIEDLISDKIPIDQIVEFGDELRKIEEDKNKNSEEMFGIIWEEDTVRLWDIFENIKDKNYTWALNILQQESKDDEENLSTIIKKNELIVFMQSKNPQKAQELLISLDKAPTQTIIAVEQYIEKTIDEIIQEHEHGHLISEETKDIMKERIKLWFGEIEAQNIVNGAATHMLQSIDESENKDQLKDDIVAAYLGGKTTFEDFDIPWVNKPSERKKNLWSLITAFNEILYEAYNSKGRDIIADENRNLIYDPQNTHQFAKLTRGNNLDKGKEAINMINMQTEIAKRSMELLFGNPELTNYVMEKIMTPSEAGQSFNAKEIANDIISWQAINTDWKDILQYLEENRSQKLPPSSTIENDLNTVVDALDLPTNEEELDEFTTDIKKEKFQKFMSWWIGKFGMKILLSATANMTEEAMRNPSNKLLVIMKFILNFIDEGLRDSLIDQVIEHKENKTITKTRETYEQNNTDHIELLKTPLEESKETNQDIFLTENSDNKGWSWDYNSWITLDGDKQTDKVEYESQGNMKKEDIAKTVHAEHLYNALTSLPGNNTGFNIPELFKKQYTNESNDQNDTQTEETQEKIENEKNLAYKYIGSLVWSYLTTHPVDKKLTHKELITWVIKLYLSEYIIKKTEEKIEQEEAVQPKEEEKEEE